MNPPEQPHAAPCPICGGELRPAFEGRVLDRIPVVYQRCQGCRSLLLPEPHWLEEAYSVPRLPDPDQGALSRSMAVHRCIRRLRSQGVGLVPRRGRVLDMGCGKGMLLRQLVEDGMDAWGHDPYPDPIFAPDRLLPDIQTAPPFDLITLIEVLEHTLDPVQTLSGLRASLKPGGLLLASTELCDPLSDDPEWLYLAPGQGQHITLFSPQGLRRAAERAGFQFLGSLPWCGRPFLHLFAPTGSRVPRLAWWLMNRRHHRGEHRHAKDRLA